MVDSAVAAVVTEPARSRAGRIDTIRGRCDALRSRWREALRSVEVCRPERSRPSWVDLARNVQFGERKSVCRIGRH